MIVNKGYPIMFDVQQCILTKTIQLNKVIARGQKDYKMVCIVLNVAFYLSEEELWHKRT
jgi:hypothetical protein